MCRYRKFGKDFRNIKKGQFMSENPNSIQANPDGNLGQTNKVSDTKEPRTSRVTGSTKPHSKGKRNFDSRNQRKGDGIPADVSEKRDSRLMDNWERFSIVNAVAGSAPAALTGHNSKYGIGREFRLLGPGPINVVGYGTATAADLAINYNDALMVPFRIDYAQVNFGALNTQYFRNRLHQLYDNYAAISRMGNGQYLREDQLWAFFVNAIHYIITMGTHKTFLHIYDRLRNLKNDDHKTLHTFIQMYFNCHLDAAIQIANNVELCRDAIETTLQLAERRVFIPNFGFLQYLADAVRTIYTDENLIRLTQFPRFIQSYGWNVCGAPQVYPLSIHNETGNSGIVHPGTCDVRPYATGANNTNVPRVANNIPVNANYANTNFAKFQAVQTNRTLMDSYFANPIDHNAGGGQLFFNEPVPLGAESLVSPAGTLFTMPLMSRIFPGFDPTGMVNVPDTNTMIRSVEDVLALAETLTVYSTVGALNVFAPKASPVDLRPTEVKLTANTKSFLKNRVYWGNSWFNTELQTGNNADLTHNPTATTGVTMTENGYGASDDTMRNVFTPGSNNYSIVYEKGSDKEAVTAAVLTQIGTETTGIYQTVLEADALFVTFINTKYSIKLRTFSRHVATNLGYPINTNVLSRSRELLPSTPMQWAIGRLIFPWFHNSYAAYNNWEALTNSNLDGYLLISVSLMTEMNHGVLNNTEYYTNNSTTLTPIALEDVTFGRAGGNYTTINDMYHVPIHTTSQVFQVGDQAAGARSFFTRNAIVYHRALDLMISFDKIQSHLGQDITLSQYWFIDGTNVDHTTSDSYTLGTTYDAKVNVVNVDVLSWRWDPEGEKQIISRITGQAAQIGYMFAEGLLDVGEAYRVGNRMTISPFYAYNFVSGMGKPRV